jgi:hypothetical protein
MRKRIISGGIVMAEHDTSNLRAPLKIHLQGPAVRHHRLPLQDFVLFAQRVQTAVDRVARVLLGQGISTQPGRKPSEVIRSCSLDLVEVRGGSVAMICDLPIQSQAELFGDGNEDLGEEALRSFVEGIEAVRGEQPALPRGYDKGVLLALRDGGKLFDRGIETITFDLHTPRGHWISHYTREVHTRILSRVQEPVQNRTTQHTVEGRLAMGDFKEAGFRCRVHPPIGKPIPCTFEEVQKEAVLAALTHYIRLIGEVTEAEGEILSLKIEHVEVLDRHLEVEKRGEKGTSFFDGKADVEALAAQQRVFTVSDFDSLLGDCWPEEESVDQFIATIREWRCEGAHRGNA